MGNQYQFTQNETKSLAGGGCPADSARFDITQFTPMQHDVLLSHSQLTPTSNFSSDSTPLKLHLIDAIETILVHCWLPIPRLAWLKAVSLPLLDMGIPPGNGHQIPGHRIIIHHVPSWSLSLCRLLLGPTIHSSLRIFIQIHCSSLALCCFTKCAKKTVILRNIIVFVPSSGSA